MRRTLPPPPRGDTPPARRVTARGRLSPAARGLSERAAEGAPEDEEKPSNARDLLNISNRTVCYRCQACRQRVSVVHGHPLFADVGHGDHGVTVMILAFWLSLETILVQILRKCDIL